MVRGSNPDGGEIFRTLPDRPWGPPSLLYKGFRVFPGDKADGAWRWPPTPSSAEVKERTELYIFWAFVASSRVNFTLKYSPIYDKNVKGKVIPTHAMKAYRWIGDLAPLIDLGIYGRWLLQLRAPAALPPPNRGEIIAGIHCTGGLVGPRVGLDIKEKR